RLLDPDAARRREQLLGLARAVYSDPDFDPAGAAQTVLALAGERAAEARAARDVPEREAEQYVRRVERGAERDEILLALEELAAWYRDLIVVAAGAERAVIHFDRLAELTEDASVERMAAAERASEVVRETWRAFEEFNLSPLLAIEALFVRLRSELRAAAPV